MDPNILFTNKAQTAWNNAIELAQQFGHSEVLPIHLARVSLFESPPGPQNVIPSSFDTMFKQVIELAHGNPQGFYRALEKMITKLPSRSPPPYTVSVSPSSHTVLEKANNLRNLQRHSFIDLCHIIIALCQDADIQTALREAAILNTDLIENAICTITQELGFTIDMTAAATGDNCDLIIGREEEIRRAMCILSQPTKHNVLLIGEPGVGKTTIIRDLAQRIAVGNVPDHLMNCKLLSLDISALIANTERGEVEGRLKRVLNDITQSPETIILCVVEIHLLIGASDVDATHLLWSILGCSQLCCIGTTTPSHYNNCIGTGGGLFEQCFHQIMIKELSLPETITILRSRKEKYDQDHGVTILDSALRASATLAARYPIRRLPASAIDLVEEAAAAVRIAHQSRLEIIESLELKLCQLTIDINALEKEKDRESGFLLAQAQMDAGKAWEERELLIMQQKRERKRHEELGFAKAKLDELGKRLNFAEYNGDRIKAAGLKYGVIPLQKMTIRMMEMWNAAVDRPTVTNIVTAESVINIVSQRMGIPITEV